MTIKWPQLTTAISAPSPPSWAGMLMPNRLARRQGEERRLLLAVASGGAADRVGCAWLYRQKVH